MSGDTKTRRIVVFVAAAAWMFLGIVIGRESAADVAPTAADKVVSSTSKRGAATGELAAAAGPDEVAIEWTRFMSTWPYLDHDKFTAQLDIRLASDAVKERARDVAGLEKIQKQLAAASTDVWWAMAPLASKVVDQGKDRATVQVWALSVKSAGSVWNPVGAYMVLNIELSLERGVWRVFSALGGDGPTPLPATSNVPLESSAAFAKALAGFVPVETGQ